MTQKEQEIFELFASELTVRSSEYYLGSEEFIDRIIESDTSLAKKIFDKIFNTKQALQKVDKNNAEVKRLLKAEKLWLDASKRIGNVQLAKYIQGKEKELKEKSQEGVENEAKTQYNKKANNQLRGIENGKNTEVLERQGVVPGNDTRNNTLWQSSNDTEKLFRWMGDHQNVRSGSEKTRVGNSGWFRTIKDNKSDILRFRKSISRNLRGKPLKLLDTAGRKLTNNQKEKFKNTVLKDDEGRLLSFFHSTETKFDTFKNGDIGFHFGTLEAAQLRFKGKEKAIKSNTSDVFVKEVYINMEEPIYLDYDPMNWFVFACAYKLNSLDYITDQDLLHLKELDGFMEKEYNSPASIELRKILSKKGYDGIIYANGFEGDLSVIAFYDEQIETVAEYSKETISSNTQFNLKSNPQISLSQGEMKKIVANHTRDKVHSRKETQIAINDILADLSDLFTDEKVTIKGKTKEEVIQMLWQGLNTVQGKDRQAFAEKVAEYIIKNSILTTLKPK